jgi:Cation transporter/ATPase, N-terminus
MQFTGTLYGARAEMNNFLESTVTVDQADQAGLSSSEAAHQLTQFGPNAVGEQEVHLPKRIAQHFWL